MIPPGQVVAHPVGGVALYAGETGTGQDERAQLGHRVSQAGGRAHGHQQCVLVVVALMRGVAAVEPHAAWGDGACRGLVHVVPNAREARPHVLGVELAPPRARLLSDEVRERRVAGPHLADVDVAAFGATQDVALERLVEHPVPGLVLDARVDDRDDSEAVVAEAPEHADGVGEPVRVPGEDAVAVHVLDIEPQHVARDGVVAVALRDRLNGVLGVAVPAGLVVSQRP